MLKFHIQYDVSVSSCFVHYHIFVTHTQLQEVDSLPRPVVLVEDNNAKELMDLVNKNEEAKVVIEIKMEPKWVSMQEQAGCFLQSCVNLKNSSVLVKRQLFIYLCLFNMNLASV